MFLLAPRADLRFGLDDAGGIYLLTKRDGAVRRIVPAVTVPALPPAGTAAWLVALAAVARRALCRTSA